MRVLYLAPKYDYGRPERGPGFEHHNFYCALRGMGLDITYFDYPTLFDQLGRREMNQRLLDTVERERPELVFGVVRNDLVDPKVVRKVSAMPGVTTVNWFCDDHWQFESQALRWTPCFNYVATTSCEALGKYKAAGLNNVIKTQWGCNHRLYENQDLAMEHDVSFVGQCYGERQRAVESLRDAGVRVACFGRGWPGGGISQEQMIRVFNTSRINLNFADASATSRTWLDNLVAGRVMQSMRTKPVAWRAWSWSHKAAVAYGKRRSGGQCEVPRQIKGRVFEVTGCGGFLLTQPAEDLGRYLSDGKELAFFESNDDLVERVQYYLAHDDERRQIAQAGHDRVLREHTYESRFTQLMQAMGMTSETTMRTAA